MKKVLLLAALLAAAVSANADVILTGIVDGDFSGGHPKAVELYVSGTEDLTGWTVKAYNNASLTNNGGLVALSGTFTNQYVYAVLTASIEEFQLIWGTSGDFGNTFTGTGPNINGDDVVMLHDAADAVVDVYGVLGVDGTGYFWDYVDSYAYKKDGVGASATFAEADWNFGGASLMAAFGDDPVAHYNAIPFGTYQIPEPATMLLLGLGGLLACRRK